MQSFIAVGLSLALGVGAGPGGAPQIADRSQQPGSERGTQTAVVRATGTIEPEEVADVGSQVVGPILKFGADPDANDKPIDYGTRVKQGTVLALIDPAPYEAALARDRANLRRAEADLRLAQARAALAEQELRRVQTRVRDKAAETADIEHAQAALEVAKAAVLVEEAGVAQAKATVQQAELNLSHCTIRSPVDGIIIDRRCNVGQTVVSSLNAPSLFLIAKDLKRLQVWTNVREADIGRVAKGQPARFTIDAYPKDTFTGRVSQIRLNATMVKDVVSYTVVIDVDNSSGKLLPYLTAQVSIDVRDRP